MCEVLRVSRSGYYSWLNRSESDRSKDNRQLLRDVRMVHGQSRRIYGSPRVAIELNESGVSCSVNRVARLMRSAGIRAKTKRKYRVTTNSKHNYPVAPNLLNRQFAVDRPNQVWLSDITYIRTTEGWLYLAVMIDLHSRRIIGWAVSNRLKRDLAIRALDMAVALRKPPPGCIHHTDRGSQYCSHEYQKRLHQNSFTVSMSGKGNCYDNAAVETFFKTVKAELIWRNTWQTRRQVHTALFQYINGFYNPRRRHSTLGGKSPLAFERKAA